VFGPSYRTVVSSGLKGLPKRVWAVVLSRRNDAAIPVQATDIKIR
jgi:hypothetical protein